MLVSYDRFYVQYFFYGVLGTNFGVCCMYLQLRTFT